MRESLHTHSAPRPAPEATNGSRREILTGGLAAAIVAAQQPVRAQSRGARLRVGIIGCGRMGQWYAEVYRHLPETEIVPIAEWNPERRKAVGERFGVRALYPDARAMLREIVPDL